MTVHVDNIGAMFLANNESSSRTKHIDVRCHFVRDPLDGPNPSVKIEFVPSEDNKADAHTKNALVNKFEQHFKEELLKKPDQFCKRKGVGRCVHVCMNPRRIPVTGK